LIPRTVDGQGRTVVSHRKAGNQYQLWAAARHRIDDARHVALDALTGPEVRPELHERSASVVKVGDEERPRDRRRELLSGRLIRYREPHDPLVAFKPAPRADASHETAHLW